MSHRKIIIIIFLPIFLTKLLDSLSLVKQNPHNLINLGQKQELIDELLKNRFTIKSTLPDLPTDISFLFLDLKINPEKNDFKVCEFGEGRLADAIYANTQINDTTYKLMTPYWHLFWKYLEKFNLPIWFIGANPTKDKIFTYAPMPLDILFGWDTFLKAGGEQFYSLAQLENSEKFRKLLKNTKTESNSTKQYKGIIVYRYCNTGVDSHYKILKLFKKRFPQLLILDSASEPYASNKAYGDSLFKCPILKKYRPKSHLYEKKYSENLLAHLEQTFGKSKLVFKPINSNRTSGVMISNYQDREAKLKIITNTSNIIQQSSSVPYGVMYKPKHPIGQDYWNHDQNHYFLVEEYCSSRHMYLEDKIYDPSLRIFLLMHHDKQNIEITVLSGYWKFPPHALEDNVPLDAKNKTDPNRIDKFMGIAISKDDMAFISKSIHSFMPHVYEKMLIAYQQKFSHLFSNKFYHSQVKR
jgi:hypothetical protein